MKNIDRGLILSLFAGYTVKCAVLGASIADALVILGLAGAHFLYNFYNRSKEIAELKAHYNKELAELKSAQYDQAVILSELRTNVTGIKLSQSMKKAL